MIDPGFLQAKPSLIKESLSNNKEKNMSEGNNSALLESVKMLKARSSQDSKVINALKAENAGLKKKINSVLGKQKAESMRNSRIIGDSKKVLESLRSLKMGNAQKCLESLQALGGKDIVDFILENKITVKTLKEFKSLLGKSESKVKVSKIPSVLKSRISQMENTIKKYKEYGSISEVSKLCSVVEKYNKLGSIPDLIKVLGEMKKKLQSSKLKKINLASESLAKQSGQSVESVRRVVQKMGITEARRIFKTVPKFIPENKRRFQRNLLLIPQEFLLSLKVCNLI